MRLKTYLGLKFRRFTNKNPSLYRPSSRPYLSGDTLRQFSDHIFDETKTLNPKKVKDNDIVFLKTDLKEIYFNHYHKKITSKYILITHNSDESIEESDLNFLDEKIIHWFAMKLNTKMNNLISPIPSGLENKRLLNNGKISNFNKILKSNEFSPSKKEKNILCSFNEYTNYEVRNPLIAIAKLNSDVDINKFELPIDYLKELSKYKYNLCPEGNNFESHRLWESLLFNSTPIVIDNFVNRNFYEMGVPLILLDNWNDLKDISINELDILNKENNNKEYKKFVHFKFWEKLILSKKIK